MAKKSDPLELIDAALAAIEELPEFPKDDDTLSLSRERGLVMTHLKAAKDGARKLIRLIG